MSGGRDDMRNTAVRAIRQDGTSTRFVRLGRGTTGLQRLSLDK
jgi:hypothetical protein